MKREVGFSSLKSFGLRLAASAAFHTGAVSLFQNTGSWKLSEVAGAPFGILLYHRVNPAEDRLFSATSVRVFDAQMRHLAANFRVLPLVEIVQRIQQGKALEPLTIAITFDDGYQDNYVYAHPVLKKYQLPATVFVAVGFTGSNRLMWNDRLAWAIRNATQKKFSALVAGQEQEFSLESEADKFASLNVILEDLKTCPDDQKEKMLDHLIASLCVRPARQDRLMLDWEELRIMAREGWDVGSHTVSHPILTRIALPQAADELKNSKRLIEQELQRPASLLAYPNGKRSDYSHDIKLAAKDAGYLAAVTTLRGVNWEVPDFYELRRWSVWEDHLPTLACKLRYSYGRKMTHEDDY